MGIYMGNSRYAAGQCRLTAVIKIIIANSRSQNMIFINDLMSKEYWKGEVLPRLDYKTKLSLNFIACLRETSIFVRLSFYIANLRSAMAQYYQPI
jgi:hypothetical protein